MKSYTLVICPKKVEETDGHFWDSSSTEVENTKLHSTLIIFRKTGYKQVVLLLNRNKLPDFKSNISGDSRDS